MKLLFSIFVVLIFASCSTMKSGTYVQLGPKDSIEKLAKEFKVPAWKIKQANDSVPFEVGQWFFIPQEVGVFRAFQDGMSPGAHRALKMAGKRFIWPVPSSRKISSGFGKRWGRRHEGIDIPAREGSHFLSIDDGVVVHSDDGLSGYGNLIVVSHKGGIFSIYAHARKMFVSKGDKVVRGQVIGQVGQTGRATGPHLHFEIRHNSRARNPASFFVKKN